MEYRKFGKTDLKTSVIGFGTWQGSMKGWGDDYSKNSIIEAIRTAYENGINFFDTAEIYGNGLSEKILGEALSIYDRDSYIIATKIAPFNLNNVEKSLKNSLNRLNIDYVDLYQIHWPPSIYTNLKSSFKELKKAINDGKIRYIGVSNFNVELLKNVLEENIVSNQVKYNIISRRIESEVLPLMKKNNIELIAYSPLEMGALTGKYNRNNKPKGYLRKGSDIFSNRNIEKLEQLNSFLKDLSEKYRCSVSQLSLAYIVKKGGLPIPGAKNAEQAKMNALASNVNISDDDLENIDKFVNNLNLEGDPSWFNALRYIPSWLMKGIFKWVI